MYSISRVRVPPPTDFSSLLSLPPHSPHKCCVPSHRPDAARSCRDQQPVAGAAFILPVSVFAAVCARSDGQTHSRHPTARAHRRRIGRQKPVAAGGRARVPPLPRARRRCHVPSRHQLLSPNVGPGACVRARPRPHRHSAHSAHLGRGRSLPQSGLPAARHRKVPPSLLSLSLLLHARPRLSLSRTVALVFLLHRYVPHLTLKRMPIGSHWTNQDNPPLVNSWMREWLSAH